MMEEQNDNHADRYFPMPEEQRPDTWQPTPGLRWKVNAVPVGTVVSYAALRPLLQQLWHIPNSEQYDWRDVPTVEEEQG